MSARIRRASTVIPFRDGAVYLVKRNAEVRFFPDYWAFPGGTLDKADEAVTGDELAPFRSAALRELEEETQLVLTEESLVPCGRLLTPEFAPVRYDTQFYLAKVPAGVEPVIDQGELVDGAWFKPTDALAAFRRWEMKIPPPTLAMLKLLRDHGPEGAPAKAASTDGQPHHERFRIEFHPGIYALPLATHTLPPATSTNCYVLGSDRMVIVDPGPIDAEALAPLKFLIDELRAEGRRFIGVLLTHHHPDHVGGAKWASEYVGAPVMASAMSRHHIPELVDQVIGDGDEIDLGYDNETESPWQLQVMATPGHTNGHLAFRDTRFDAVLVGDLMSGVSTIVIDPPEGDMAKYLASLRKVRDLDPAILMPAHGPAFPDAARAIDTLVRHRQDREVKIVAALAKHPKGAHAKDLVPDAYEDTPPMAWGLAERSLIAVLLKLEEEGRAVRDGDTWRAGE